MAITQKQILIVDAGSTKTQWYDASTGNTVITPGINPIHIDDTTLVSMLYSARNELICENLMHIAWYGAGCQSAAICGRVKAALNNVFGKDIDINVGSDLLCAARATAGKSAGIVCIIGTGSNSGVYDGHNIVDNIPPLGYILGDEGSGAAIGKRFANALLKRGLSHSLTKLILQETGLCKDEVQHHVYQQPEPNRYLASLAKIVAAYIEYSEIEDIVRGEIRSFLNNNVLRYEQAPNLPIHFVGGIAFHYRDILKEELSNMGLKPGIIIRNPLDNISEPMHFI